MVNLSFDTGILPDWLKETLVHSLLKNILLDMDIFNNYRTIYNLAPVSKVMEKGAAVWLNKHMDIDDLHVFQSAYKELNFTVQKLLLWGFTTIFLGP